MPKKIKVPCEKVFNFKPTLDMLEEGPVILTSCKSSTFAFSARARTDPNSPPAILSISSIGEKWYWAWHFTAAAAAPVKEDELPHRLTADNWATVAKLLGDTHPDLIKLPQVKDVIHDPTGDS